MQKLEFKEGVCEGGEMMGVLFDFKLFANTTVKLNLLSKFFRKLNCTALRVLQQNS